MPHIIVEKNHRDLIDDDSLIAALHSEAKTIEAFPTGGIRTRIITAEPSRVGAGDGAGNFCYVTVRIGQGRSEAVRRDVGDRLFQVLTDWAAPAVDSGKPVSLGLEIQEINSDWTWKSNNIHAMLAADTA